METCPPEAPRVDPVVEAYKKDVDVTLLARNLRMTHSERLQQLQRFVAFIAETQAAGRQARGGA